MMAMPAQLPNDMPHQCVFKAAVDYRIPPAILYAIRKKEGGKVGQSSRNTNNTRDYNQTQINDVWMQTFYKKQGVHPYLLANDACLGIRATAYIVRYEIERVGNFWRGVGNYHSRTPSRNAAYAREIYDLSIHYQKILSKMGWIK